MEEGKQVRQGYLLSFFSLSLLSTGCGKGSSTYAFHFCCMNNRIVLRSLVTSDGCLTAMDDGMIIWKPTLGRRQQTKLDSLVTVLLAFKSINNRLESIIVGDYSGGITHLSVPCLEVINKFNLEGESIRSICSASESTHRLLVACQSGSIWVVGDQVPSRKIHLFQNEGPITSIRVCNNEIHLQSGWQRRVLDFTGCELSYHDVSAKFKKKDEIRAVRRARLLEAKKNNSYYPTTPTLDLSAVA